MDLIPAIDIIEGKCVRLTRGDYKLKKIYSADPLKLAQIFQRAGFKKLHLVDLEGTKEEKIKNWQTIKKIAKNTGLLIEFGGGIRGQRDIRKLLESGVDKVVFGSLVLKTPGQFKKIFKKFQEKIIISVDIKKDRIYYRGWQKKSEKEIYPFLKELTKLGVKNIICTDIERDGMLNGPNLSLYKKLVKKFPKLKITASGGIRNKKDLEKLIKIGVSGAIIGKAIYEKTLFLSELKILFKTKRNKCHIKKYQKLIGKNQRV